MNFAQYAADLLDDDQFENEVLGIDRLENLATQLARELKLADPKSKDRNLLPEIRRSSEELLESYRYLSADISHQTITPASEWFLDNFHIIEDQLRTIKRDLPKDFYRELPKVLEGEFAGLPRVYAITFTLVRKTDSRLDVVSIERFVRAFQQVTPLSIGELWAVAITFRASLIKQLHPLVDRIIFARKKREEGDHIADKLLKLASRPGTRPEELVTFLSQSIGEQHKFNRPLLVQLIQRLRDQDPSISRAFDWLEETLGSCQTSTGQIVKLEHYRQAAAQVTIGNIITSMRLLSKLNWHDFFESVSLVDPILNHDPAGAYALMDRATRDIYRKEIERISRRCNYTEIEVANKVLELTEKITPLDPLMESRKKHVGFYLLDDGVLTLEKELKYRSPLREKFIRFIDEDPSFVYFGSLGLLIILLLSLILKIFPISEQGLMMVLAAMALVLIPISELALSILNWTITILRLPKRLSRMETEKGIPPEATSMVVVPCLLSSTAIIEELINNLEVQYLANQDPHIYFSILGDLTDAATETTEKDQDLLAFAHRGIADLNRRYNKGTDRQRFYLFHRIRLFNSSEGKWICWERKRGKIEEFNRLIRGDTTTTFIDPGLDLEFFGQIKYVITLDADTQLPLQSARKLIGTIIHPLNQPVISPKENRVVAGYGILQPRISVSIVSAAKTRFSRIFSGNTGIDPYTTAVSDVYQDLFKEGSFTGKGLYVVDAFEQVVGKRIPENCVLSHDLLEGSYARVGLTTDLELIDDFPSNFEVFSKRSHRWTRGDWQIALWLFPFVRNKFGKFEKNRLPLIARWKIFDNLRRSLLTPNILLWLLLSWTILPGSALGWTVAIIVAMGFPVYAPSLRELLRKHEHNPHEHLKVSLLETRKRLEQIFLMVILMPVMAVDQLDAIIRSLYRMMVSKKQLLEWVTFSQIQAQQDGKFGWKDVLSSGPLIAGAMTVTILLVRPMSLFIASPFLICWGLAPFASRFTKQRIRPNIRPLQDQEIRQYRRYARMTWHFFENFARADNNWLAPDNFQEDPLPVVARRTSPTNIGLQLLSILSAYDLGHIGFRQMVELLEKALYSLSQLERMKGHFYNWYDTRSFSPLEPRYISTVDSGNLAGHLIVLKQAALKLSQGPFQNTKAHEGLRDGIEVLRDLLINLQKNSALPKSSSFNRALQELDEVLQNLTMPLEKVLEKFSQTSSLLIELDQSEASGTKRALQWLGSLTQQVHSYQADEKENPQDLAERLVRISETSQEIFQAMDFSFLFDQERKIFTIGYNATDGRKDDSYYDLLASESRLTSFIAIAKGDVPDEHWFHLGRKLTSVVGGRALISWSASMFEYLMPLLVMRRFPETLLDQTYHSVVLRQLEYGKQRQVPWGISESGYNARDLNFNYQYGPFGIPGLGLKRGLRDELVISPYSTLMAAMVLPKESLENLQHLEKIQALGNFGFYEAIDFTSERVPKGQQSVVLKSYMAHHQGMSLVAINNLINNSIMQRRFHAEPRIKAVQLLLQERIPPVTLITTPRAEETHIESFARFGQNHYTRIYSDPSLSTPRTHILSNENYSVMMSSAGSGYSSCEGRAVTRWKPDSTQDNWGQFIFIRNLTDKKVWSAGFQPIETRPKKYEAHFSEDKIEITREDSGIHTHTEVIVSSEDNVEIRRVTLTNNSDVEVELEVTSYMEIVLARPNDDAAHPAFSNLFVQTEYRLETTSLLANRRLRTKGEMELWGLHVLTSEADTIGPVEYETDRSKFIGRGRSVKNPAALSSRALSNSAGAVLDPIFSLRQKIRLGARQTGRLTFATGLVYSRIEAERVSEKYHDNNIFLRQSNLGWVKGQIDLRHLNITMEKAHIYQRLGGRLLYLAPYLRAQSKVLMANKRNQSALWAYGISGDLPIVLTRIHNEKDMDMIRELLRAHEYLRLKGLRFDLVILNEHAISYMQNLQDELMRQILISGFHSLLDRPGGIFIRKADMIPADDLVLLKSVARLILFADKGTLFDQLRRRPVEAELPARFVPITQKKQYSAQPTMVPPLKFYNGLGGYTPDGKEYVITLRADEWTPAPWINVVANHNDFGFIVSETGLGYTWSVNSRENRLSTWSNDPVSDPPAEAIYLRDEESGEIWSPTPLPIRGPEDYIIRHGAGQTVFHHESHGIAHRLAVYVPLNDTVKIVRVRLKNNSGRVRKLSLTGYIEWVLGFSRVQSAQTLTTLWDEEAEAIFAMNTYNNEFAHRVAFICTGLTSSYTGNRKEFIGRNGHLGAPAGLGQQKFSGKTGGGIDPCGVVQTQFELKPNDEREIIILIGQGENDEEARRLCKFYKNTVNAEAALQEVQSYWDQTLSAVTIKTPDASMDMLVNRWLLYQTLACRIWARSAFYQSGGAFGYRDQLQDVMAMVYSHPEITREQIKLAASRQFPEGDVQHWWHPPTGRGVRTRFSDDLLWLPFVLNYYVDVTADHSVLDEVVPFIETPVLSEGHDETYTHPSVSSKSASVYEHCVRTLDRSLKTGAHGLPLMGSGDWNDGMSRVGNLGKGESVWLAWFLMKTLRGFIPHCQRRNDTQRAKMYLAHIDTLKAALEKNAWDGEWYVRAYFDNGDKLGSKDNEECKIDAIAQSWSLISGEGNHERSKRALEAVNQHLIDRQAQIIKLFTPPFDKSAADPGYIKGYVPGVRENGGQYTHAAIWTMMAYAALGDGKTAHELFSLINPINRSATPVGAHKYKVEPYVISADIYGVPPHVGRGGWSWYTGSSSWMYRSAIESILGFKVQGNEMTISPCIPDEWEGFSLTYRRSNAVYEIRVLNNRPKASIEVDGKLIEGSSIQLESEGNHSVVVNRAR